MTADEYIEMYPHQFSDNLDKWLFKEFNLSGGACSSIRSMEYNTARDVAVKLLDSLWKDAQGDDLPEIDREVIVLVQDYPDDKEHLRVAFAHRPNKYTKVWNYDLGEEQIVEVECYDKGGWNIPDVKWWLDCSMPKVEED